VITSGPWDSRGDTERATISQLATAAVVRAADSRYGDTCCSRGAHTLSKLYYAAGPGPITTRIECDTQEPAGGAANACGEGWAVATLRSAPRCWFGNAPFAEVAIRTATFGGMPGPHALLSARGHASRLERRAVGFPVGQAPAPWRNSTGSEGRFRAERPQARAAINSGCVARHASKRSR
jgi:hypothetical protein